MYAYELYTIHCILKKLVAFPLKVDIEIGQVVRLWNLELLPCGIGILFPSLGPIENGRYAQHGYYDLCKET